MPRIRFLPSDTLIECDVGQSIFDVGWKKDVDLRSACIGKGTCGLCRIVVVAGADHLSPYNDVEEKHLGNLYHLTKRRLSCQSLILDGADEIVVEVPPKKKRSKS